MGAIPCGCNSTSTIEISTTLQSASCKVIAIYEFDKPK